MWRRAFDAAATAAATAAVFAIHISQPLESIEINFHLKILVRLEKEEAGYGALCVMRSHLPPPTSVTLVSYTH